MSPSPAEVRLMLARCGMSQTDAADYVGKDARVVRRWISGEYDIPAEHWQRREDLCARQDRAAAEALDLIGQQRHQLGETRTMTLPMARTDEDAERLGWPCVGAHVAVIRRIVERAPEGLRVVPVYPGEDEAADVAALRRAAH